jgi:hypothetical protein
VGLRSFISNSKTSRSFGALCLACLLIAGMESLLAVFGPQSDMVDRLSAARITIEETPPPSLQIMGDSVAKGGVVCSVLSRNLEPSYTIRNWSLAGTTPIFTYFFLKQQLDAGHTPDAVMWAHSPHTYGVTRFGILVASFCTWPEIGELFLCRSNTMGIVFGLLHKLSYTMRYREQVRTGLKDCYQSLRLQLERTGVDETRGKCTADSKTRLPPVPGQMYFDPFLVSELNAFYIDAFFDLAEKYGIKVYLTTLPESRAVYSAREGNGFHKQYLNYLSGLAVRHGATLLLDEIHVLPDSQFADHSHVTGDGATVFSSILADALTAASD